MYVLLFIQVSCVVARTLVSTPAATSYSALKPQVMRGEGKGIARFRPNRQKNVVPRGIEINLKRHIHDFQIPGAPQEVTAVALSGMFAMKSVIA